MSNQPLNPQRNQTDCTPRELFPEICYPANDPKWSRLTQCDEQGNPCQLDLSGLVRPGALVRPDTDTPTPGVVGNEELTVTCPGSYREGSDPGGSYPGVTIPAGQFFRAVPNVSNSTEVQEAQDIVDAFAEIYAWTQIQCYAWNAEVTESCPAGLDPSDMLDTDNITEKTVNTNTVSEALDPAVRAANEQVRLSYDHSLVSVGDYVVQLDLAGATDEIYFEVTGFADGLTGLAVYASPVTLTAMHAALEPVDQAIVDQLASDIARASLVCVYLNPEASVACPLDTNGAEASDILGVKSSTIDMGTLSYLLLDLDDVSESTVAPDQTGLGTLEYQAKVLAAVNLICYYVNEEQTVTCPDASIDTTACADSINTTKSAQGPGEYTVQAGTIFSQLVFSPEQLADPENLEFSGVDTVEDLTNTAWYTALASVQCVYGNVALLCDCACQAAGLPAIVTSSAPINHLESDFTSGSKVSDCAAIPGSTVNSTPANVSFLDIFPSDANPINSVLPGTPPAIRSGSKDAVDAVIASRVLGRDPVALLTPDCEGNTLWSANQGLSSIGNVGVNTFFEVADFDRDLYSSLADQAAAFALLQAAADLALLQATQAAEALANAIRLCVWTNEEVSNSSREFSISCDQYHAEDDGQLLTPKFISEVPGPVIPAGAFVSTESKFDAQLVAWLAAYAGRICVPGQFGNKAMEADCPDHLFGNPLVPGVDENLPVIAGETFFGSQEYEATLAAFSLLCASRMCIWGNTEQTPDDCPAGLISNTDSEAATIKENTFFAYDVGDEIDKVAKKLANALRICVNDPGSGDNPFGEDTGCQLKLTGSYSKIDDVADPDSITWAVTAGSVKSVGADTVISFGGDNGDYMPTYPHFYLQFDVDSDGNPDTSGDSDANIEVIRRQTKSTHEFTVSPTDSTKGLLYIGTFKGYGVGTSIDTENTLCAAGTYEYTIGGGGSFTHPLQIVKTGDTSVKIRYGSVNSVAPSKVDPNLDNAYEWTGVSDGDKFWLDVTLTSATDQSVSSVDIVKQSSKPTESATKASVLIGSVTVADSVITGIGQNLRGSAFLVSCGEVHVFGT
jgi:hypothetical protein